MAGSNAGGNLNIFLFEVGFLAVDDETGDGQPFTVGVHPLVVAPRDITYVDASRSPTTQTSTGAVKTTSGRALRQVTLTGNFGVDSRGLGLYLGTGEVRFHRFYNEVVRMGDALSKNQVDDAVDILRGSLLIKLKLLPYDPERHVPYINFYDFFNERQFGCTVKSWQDSRHSNQGGASGLVHYQMQLQEDGPIITGSLGSQIISALFNGLTTWKAINDVLKSYTLGAIFDGIAAAGAIVFTQFNATLGALKGQVDSVSAIVGGFAPRQGVNDGLNAYFTNAQALDANAQALIDSVTSVGSPQAGNDTGSVSWSSTEGEGSNAGLDTSDQIDDLEDVADAARWQLASGVLFGWDRETYQAYITGQTEGGRANDVAGSVRYVVGPTDTERSLEERFGIPFDRILAVNGMTPDEALFEGAELQVPRARGRGSQTIDGLPTFGSHVGRSAWGSDLFTDLRTVDGRFELAMDSDVLEQGVAWLIDVFAEPMLNLINDTPELVRTSMLRIHLERALLSDKRISGVDRLDIDLDSGSGVAGIRVTLSAINGGTIQTGTPRTST